MVHALNPTSCTLEHLDPTMLSVRAPLESVTKVHCSHPSVLRDMAQVLDKRPKSLNKDLASVVQEVGLSHRSKDNIYDPSL